MAPSANVFLQGDPATDDSDTELDSAAPDAYYRQITAEDDDSDSVGDPDPDPPSPLHANGIPADLFHLQIPNPNPSLENGVAALHLNDPAEEEEDEEMEREASISRALMEDEARRRAPLPPEAATRIVNAMRGVSFQGLPPVWIDEVPEERWVDQLQRLRVYPFAIHSRELLALIFSPLWIFGDANHTRIKGGPVMMRTCLLGGES